MREADGAPRKEHLRREILSRRQALSQRAAVLRSRLICRHVARLAAYRQARTILFYYPVRREVNPLPLLRQTVAAGRTAVLPVAHADGRLGLGAVRGFEDLHMGPYKIPAPRREDQALASGLELVIVPGLAFCHGGFRLGYGGGYYDRFLASLRAPGGAETPSVGLAYRWALHSRLPRAEHDQAVELVVTEDGARAAGGT